LELSSLLLKTFLFNWSVGWGKRDGRRCGKDIGLFGMPLFRVFSEREMTRYLRILIRRWMSWRWGI